jgi:hypothetical protein
LQSDWFPPGEDIVEAKETADRFAARSHESGFSEAQEALIPGESLPVAGATGHRLLAGAVDLDRLRRKRSRHPAPEWIGGLLLGGALIVLVVGWVGYESLYHYDIDKEGVAKRGCHALSHCVEIYKVNNGQYPTRIEQLAQPQPNGEGPLVPLDQVIDPWGKPYKIDPTGRRGGGVRAEVHTTNPKGVVISNFSK